MDVVEKKEFKRLTEIHPRGLLKENANLYLKKGCKEEGFGSTKGRDLL